MTQASYIVKCNRLKIIYFGYCMLIVLYANVGGTGFKRTPSKWPSVLGSILLLHSGKIVSFFHFIWFSQKDLYYSSLNAQLKDSHCMFLSRLKESW